MDKKLSFGTHINNAPVWAKAVKKHTRKLQIIRNKYLKIIICNLPRRSPTNRLHEDTKMLVMSDFLNFRKKGLLSDHHLIKKLFWTVCCKIPFNSIKWRFFNWCFPSKYFDYHLSYYGTQWTCCKIYGLISNNHFKHYCNCNIIQSSTK